MLKPPFVLASVALSLLSGAAHAQKVLTLPPEVRTPAPPKLDPKADAAKAAAFQVAGRKAIAGQYTSVANATVRNDLPDVMRVVAPDFQYYDTTGKIIDRVGYEQLQAETLKKTTKVRFSYTIKSVTWRGMDAVVQAESRFVGVYDYKRFDLRTTSRDYWSAAPRGWMIRQRVDQSIRGFLNGVKVEANPLAPQLTAPVR